jgi:hypothetical protein
VKRRVTAAFVVVVVALGLVATPAPAAPAPRAAITLASQPATTPLGGDLPIDLRIDGDPAGLDVRVVVRRAVTSRDGFEQSIMGEDLGGVVGTTQVPVATLPATPGGRLLTLRLEPTDGSLSADRIAVRQPGVYPLVISLVGSSGKAVDGFVSHLVAVTPTAPGTPAIGEPLRVAWVWPMVAAPAFQADGRADPAAVDTFAPEGRLGSMARVLAHSDGVPVTLAPGPETAQSWASLTRTHPELSAGIASLRSATTVDQTLSAPYVSLDMPSLEAGGFGSEPAPEYAAGTDALNTTLGTRVDPRTVLADPVDSASLARLRQIGADRVVVRPSALVPADTKFTPAAPFELEAPGRTFTAAAADEGLAALLDGDAPVALRAERFLSALAVIANEQPNRLRGVVVLPASGWNPPSELLTRVIDGLRGNPLVTPVSLDALLDTVPVEGGDDPTVRKLTGSALTATPVTEARYRAGEQQLDALRQLVGRTDERVVDGEQALLLALSSTWQTDTGRRRAEAELATIDESVASIVAGVHVPESRTLTLTARRAEIPVSFQNDTGRDVQVRVSLESDKLYFPSGSTQILTLPPRNTTARFAVETRASGTFPLLLTVSSTDERVTFQESRITVRSTVVSNIGLFLTIGAGLFLAGWWLNHARRRRRAGTSRDPAP